MSDLNHFTPLISELHLPVLIAGIVLAVGLTRLLTRVLGRLIDRALPPSEHERKCECRCGRA